MPGMAYEERELVLEPGDSVLLHSDGIVEAHDPDREMFGFPRLMAAVASYPGGAEVIDLVLRDVNAHTGPDVEQEDDITMVTVRARPHGEGRRLLLEFEVPSAEGNERLALARVADEVAPLGPVPARLDRLKTAVGEATMNAMEHGNSYRADLPVRSGCSRTATWCTSRSPTEGHAAPAGPAEEPDLEAKLAGLQRPRGWGLYLIKNMVDEFREITDDGQHTLELTMRLGGNDDR